MGSAVGGRRRGVTVRALGFHPVVTQLFGVKSAILGGGGGRVALVGTVGPYGPIACCVAWSQELCWCIRARHGELGTCRSRVPWGCAVPCRAGSVGCSCLLPAATGGCWKGRELRAQIERAMGSEKQNKVRASSERRFRQHCPSAQIQPFQQRSRCTPIATKGIH